MQLPLSLLENSARSVKQGGLPIEFPIVSLVRPHPALRLAATGNASPTSSC